MQGTLMVYWMYEVCMRYEVWRHPIWNILGILLLLPVSLQSRCVRPLLLLPCSGSCYIPPSKWGHSVGDTLPPYLWKPTDPDGKALSNLFARPCWSYLRGVPATFHNWKHPPSFPPSLWIRENPLILMESPLFGLYTRPCWSYLRGVGSTWKDSPSLHICEDQLMKTTLVLAIQ